MKNTWKHFIAGLILYIILDLSEIKLNKFCIIVLILVLFELYQAVRWSYSTTMQNNEFWQAFKIYLSNKTIDTICDVLAGILGAGTAFFITGG